MKHFYYVRKGEKHGPFSQQKIVEKIKCKEICKTDLIWAPHYTDWKEVEQTEFSIYVCPNNNFLMRSLKISCIVVGIFLSIAVFANLPYVNKNLRAKVAANNIVDRLEGIPRITINQIEHLGDQFTAPSYILEVNFLGISKLTTDLLYGADAKLMHITVQDKQGSIFSNVSLSKERDGKKLVNINFGEKIRILGKVFKLYTQYNTVEYIFTGVLVD